MRKLAFYLTILFFAGEPHAVGATLATVTGTVTKVEYPNAQSSAPAATIWVTGLPVACAGSEARFAIGLDHPQYYPVLSAVLGAQVRGATVDISYLDTCTAHPGAWDFAIFSVH